MKVEERLKHSPISLSERGARLTDETFLIIFYVVLNYLKRLYYIAYFKHKNNARWKNMFFLN